jgi:hypothetical protein
MERVLFLENRTMGGVNYGPDYVPVGDVPALEAKVLRKRGIVRDAWLGPCTRETARCDTATHPRVQTNPCCVRAAVETLRFIQQVFDEHGVRWWADYGTLLGAACGGRFFWNDKDCDIGVLAEDQATVLRMRGIFSAAGFRFTYAPPRQGGRYVGGDRVKVRWSETNGANTDVFFWHLRGEVYDRRAYIGVDRHKGKEFPADWLEPFAEMPLEDLVVPVPNEWELLGEHRYGRGFRRLVAAVRGGMDPVEAGRRRLPPARTDGVRR